MAAPPSVWSQSRSGQQSQAHFRSSVSGQPSTGSPHVSPLSLSTSSRPHPHHQAFSPSPSPLSPLLGLPLRLSLASSSSQAQGVLYSYDPLLNLVILQTDSTQAQGNNAETGTKYQSLGVRRKDYKLIKVRDIKSIEVLHHPQQNGAGGSPATGGSPGQGASANGNSHEPATFAKPPPGLAALRTIELAKVSQKFNKIVQAEQAKLARIGVGVTSFGQEIFDALAKTLPVRWAGTNIVVMEELMINPPYDVANVKGGKGSDERVSRVKRVLEGERARILARQATSSSLKNAETKGEENKGEKEDDSEGWN